MNIGIDYGEGEKSIYGFGFYTCPILLEDNGYKLFVFNKTPEIVKYIISNMHKEIVEAPYAERTLPNLSLNKFSVSSRGDNYIEICALIDRKHTGDLKNGKSTSLYKLFYLIDKSRSLRLFAWVRVGGCYAINPTLTPKGFNIESFLEGEERVEDVRWGKVSATAGA